MPDFYVIRNKFIPGLWRERAQTKPPGGDYSCGSGICPIVISAWSVSKKLPFPEPVSLGNVTLDEPQ